MVEHHNFAICAVDTTSCPGNHEHLVGHQPAPTGDGGLAGRQQPPGHVGMVRFWRTIHADERMWQCKPNNIPKTTGECKFSGSRKGARMTKKRIRSYKGPEQRLLNRGSKVRATLVPKSLSLGAFQCQVPRCHRSRSQNACLLSELAACAPGGPVPRHIRSLPLPRPWGNAAQ